MARTYATRPNPTDAELLAWALQLWPDARTLFDSHKSYYREMYRRERDSKRQRKAA